MPLWQVLVSRYRDLAMESVVAGHWRTLNHPIHYTEDAGGWLGWLVMDTWVSQHVGRHLPLICTEAGPEPGWDQDKRYPRVTPELHAQMVREQLEWPTPPHYLADCFWLWEGAGPWAAASWKRNRQWTEGASRDLPVVEVLTGWQEDMSNLTDDDIRRIGMARPVEVRINPDAALYRAAQATGLGHPLTNEWDESGWRLQRYERGIVACPIGRWDEVRVIR